MIIWALDIFIDEMYIDEMNVNLHNLCRITSGHLIIGFDDYYIVSDWTDDVDNCRFIRHLLEYSIEWVMAAKVLPV